MDHIWCKSHNYWMIYGEETERGGKRDIFLWVTVSVSLTVSILIVLYNPNIRELSGPTKSVPYNRIPLYPVKGEFPLPVCRNFYLQRKIILFKLQSNYLVIDQQSCSIYMNAPLSNYLVMKYSFILVCFTSALFNFWQTWRSSL